VAAVALAQDDERVAGVGVELVGDVDDVAVAGGLAPLQRLERAVDLGVRVAVRVGALSVQVETSQRPTRVIPSRTALAVRANRSAEEAW
jgi:hypothetical protein